MMNKVAQKHRILIVDDEPAIQQVLCFFFKLHNFEVLSVSGGQEAIQVIPDFRPQLIVLDLVMRPVSGWDVLEWLHVHRLERVRTLLAMSSEQRTMLRRRRMDEQRRILKHLHAAQAENVMY
jgi:DNA-binding response OmpR family regulator